MKSSRWQVLWHVMKVSTGSTFYCDYHSENHLCPAYLTVHTVQFLKWHQHSKLTSLCSPAVTYCKHRIQHLNGDYGTKGRGSTEDINQYTLAHQTQTVTSPNWTSTYKYNWLVREVVEDSPNAHTHLTSFLAVSVTSSQTNHGSPGSQHYAHTSGWCDINIPPPSSRNPECCWILSCHTMFVSQ